VGEHVSAKQKVMSASPYWLGVAIACLAILLYWNSLGNQFVNMDDLDLIVRNKYIKALNLQNIQAIFTPGVVGSYQPIRTLSYAIDYHIWKLNPIGYHLTNIGCHALNTFLVYVIVYVLGSNVLMACLTATFFALHPVQVEAVTWLSGRRDVLSVAFALLSLYCFLQFAQKFRKTEDRRQKTEDNGQSRERQNQETHTQSTTPCLQPTPSPLLPLPFFYLLSLVLFALGLLTKPLIVILPLLLVFYDVCFLPPLYKKWQRALYYVPFFLIAVGFTKVFVSLSRATGMAKASYHGGNIYATFLTMLRVFTEYIAMLFVPRKLSLTYGVQPVFSVWEGSFLIAVVVLILLLIATVFAWKRARLVFLGIGWFFMALLPVSNIIPISTVKADRYLYLPSVGFFLVIAWLLARGWTFLQERKVAFAPFTKLLPVGYWMMVAMIVFSYAWSTVQRNRDWKDSETLWAATLETTPNSPIALNNLGLIYTEQGLYEKAIALYEQVLDLYPDIEKIEQVYGNLASAYIGQQKYDQALDYFQKSLEANPEYEPAYLGLGRVSMELGQYDNAAGIYRQALALHPQSEAVYNQIGNLSVVQGKYDDAIVHYQKAIALNPFYLEAYNGLGLCYAGKGDLNNALVIFQQALRIDPDSPVIRNSLGSLYMQQGETSKAIKEFQQSLARDPQNIEVRNNLGVLFLRTQRYKDALQEFMAAATIQPDNPKILSNLGMTYAHIGLYQEAIQLLRQAVQLDPSLFRTYILLGDVCFGTKDVACAIDAYQQALTLQPNNQEAQEKLQTAKEQQAGNR
jgi:tetratricopeptide (TPR) repeat protein